MTKKVVRIEAVETRVEPNLYTRRPLHRTVVTVWRDHYDDGTYRDRRVR